MDFSFFGDLWGALSHLSGMELFPWVISALSLTCVYLLNNYKMKAGRYLGILVAICWFTFGFITHQWFFMFTNMVYAYIYITAIVRFNKKSQEFKHITDEQAQRILELEATLHQEYTDRNYRLVKNIRRMQRMTSSELDHIDKIERFLSKMKRELSVSTVALSKMEAEIAASGLPIHLEQPKETKENGA